MKILGQHLLVEFYGCNQKALNDEKFIRDSCEYAVRCSGASIIGIRSHQVEPQGVSVVILVAESHLSIHTWPEYGYAGIDYFTCGDRVKPQNTIDCLRNVLRPDNIHSQKIDRGKIEQK